MSNESPEISIILPVKNGEATIADQLESLDRTIGEREHVEIIVADNGSADSTREIVRGFSSRLPIRIVDASRRPGANAARNDGVLASRGSMLLFCDADDEVDDAWMDGLVGALHAGADLAAGPIDYRRLNTPEVRAWRGSDQAGVSTALSFLPMAHTANLAVTRELFDRIRGFDEGFVGAGDDIEFVWRAQLAGGRLVEVPDAVVHYRLRPTLREHFRQSVVYGGCEPLLYRRFRDAGLRRRPLSDLGRDIWWLVTRMPFARPISRRGAWVRRFGQQYGRFRNAMRTRTLWW